MNSKFMITMGIFVGSSIGGWIGGMLGGGLFSVWGVILSTVGGIAGVFLGNMFSA